MKEQIKGNVISAASGSLLLSNQPHTYLSLLVPGGQEDTQSRKLAS